MNVVSTALPCISLFIFQKNKPRSRYVRWCSGTLLVSGRPKNWSQVSLTPKTTIQAHGEITGKVCWISNTKTSRMWSESSFSFYKPVSSLCFHIKCLMDLIFQSIIFPKVYYFTWNLVKSTTHRCLINNHCSLTS